MSAKISHPDKDNYQMLSGNSFQNCSMSNMKMLQGQDMSKEVLDNYMNLGAGRFGAFSQLHREQNKPLHVPLLTESILVPGNLVAPGEDCPLSVPIFCVAPPRARDASTLMCPIMMLKKPPSFQKDVNAEATECQSNPVSETSHTQQDTEHDTTVPSSETDRAVQYTESDKAVPYLESDRTVSYTESDRTVSYTESDRAVPHTESDRTVPHTESDRTVPHTESDRTVPHTELGRNVPSTELYTSASSGCASNLEKASPFTECGVFYNPHLQIQTNVQSTPTDRPHTVARSGSYNHFHELQGRRYSSSQSTNQMDYYPESNFQHFQEHTYHHGHHPQLSSSDGSYFPPHTFQNRQCSTESGGNQSPIGNHDYFLNNKNAIHYHQTHMQHQTHIQRTDQLSGNGRISFNPALYVYDPSTEEPSCSQDGTACYVHQQRNFHGFVGIKSSRINPCGPANFFPNHTPGGAAHQFPQQQQPMADGCRQGINIRWQEKETIKGLLNSRQVIQVCGAPMIGKSTIVRQAIKEVAVCNRQLIQHHITCKNVSSFQDFLSLVGQKFCPQHSYGSRQDADTILSIICSVLQQHHLYHHILVFHKCENLKGSPNDRQFLDFLGRIRDELTTVPITIVFTTYKFYWLPRNEPACNVEIGVLPIYDIINLLHYYVPQIDVVTYAHVLAKTFCYPEAIRLIVEEFLVDEHYRPTPEKLEKKINSDSQFLSQLFQSRLQEVETWVPRQGLAFLTHFRHSVENSFTEAHLEYTNDSDMDPADAKKVISYLKQNYVVRLLHAEINRLVIHPLVVYHSMTSQNRDNQLLPQKWFDSTCNRYTNFLGCVLLSAEASMQEHGRKGLVYGGLFQEWPNVRHVIEMAIHCNTNTYENFLKVAVFASGFILKIFPKEAEGFYWGLYNGAKNYGSPCDLAVMEAMLGQALAEGSGNKDWAMVDGYLSSAIQRLSQYGNSYFLGRAILRKAIILHRQGKYKESSGFFTQSRNVLRNVNRWALGEKFVVSEAKVEEEIITEEIQETIPIIFTGQPVLARKRLDRLLEVIQTSFENHPELATLLNLVGLTEQRGNKDLERAIRWYRLSYNERLYLAKMCPESLLAVLNNIGVILFHQGKADECMKYLMQALDIRRECGWTHYNTGLTLIHVAEINLKMGNYAESFKQALEADRIFSATVKDHDMRLRSNFVLAHIRSILRQALEPDRGSLGDAADNCRYNRDRREVVGHSGYARNRPGFGEETSVSSENEPTRTAELCGADGGNAELSGADRGNAGRNKKKNLRGNPLFSYTNNSLRTCPTREDIVRVVQTEIQPCDLQMSAEGYLEKLPIIATSMNGTFSDDGLSNVLCSHEHAMLLNLDNSPEKFQEHKNALAEFSRDNPWLEEDGEIDGAGMDSKYRCLIKHKPLYSYIMNTPYSELDLATFIQLMLNACLTCRFAKSVLTKEMWTAEAQHCIQERKRKKRWMDEFDRMRIDSSVSEQIREDDGVFHGVKDLSVETDNPLQEYISRQLNQRRLTALSSSASEVDVKLPVESSSRLPRFDELISNSSSHNQFPPHQLQNNDEIQHPAAYQEQAAVSSGSPLCQSPFVVPRIANDQRNIMDKIQNCRSSRSSLHSAGVNIESHSSPAFCEKRKTSNDTKTRTDAYLQVLREPVEQSYNGGQNSSWNSDGSLLARNDKELQDKFERNVFEEFNQQNHLAAVRSSMFDVDRRELDQCHAHKESGIHGRQTIPENDILGLQTIPETDNTAFIIDFVRNMTRPENLSKFHLVQEECRLDEISATNNQVCPFDISEESKPNNTSQMKSSNPGQNKFSILDYLNKNGFNVNLSKIDETETQIGKTHQENSWQNVQDLIQGSLQPTSMEHQLVHSGDVKVSGSNTVTHMGSETTVPNTNIEVLASTQRPPDSAETHSENGSQFHIQHPFHDVHECLSERVPKIPQASPVLQQVEDRDSPEDSQNVVDSVLESLSKNGFSDRANQNRRGSGSECCNISRRSRTESASSSSSSSCPDRHVMQAPESGYQSQLLMTGARSRIGSGTDRSQRNLTTTSQYSSHLMTSKKAGGLQIQGFSEIQFNTADGFQAVSGSTPDTEDVGADFYIADVKRSCTKQTAERNDPDIGGQSVDSCSSLRHNTQIFLGNQNGSPSSRAAVEQSWNETLTPNELQSRTDYVVPIIGGVFRPEVLHLQARNYQNQSEQASK